MIRSWLYNFGLILLIFFVPTIAIAQNMTGTNYQIENPTIDGGGEPSQSTNYKSRDSIAGSDDSKTESTNYKIFPGFQQHAYPGVPTVPIFTNTGGTLYNSLDFALSTSGNPGENSDDTAYAIAISSDNFVTTYYVQADDTLGTSPAWQTFNTGGSHWNGTTGERITGLAPSTTYKIKVKARSGPNAEDHTETAYSGIATASTVAPNLTIVFSGVSSPGPVDGITLTTSSSANSISYSSLPVSTARLAAHQITVTTNAAAGYVTTLRQDGNLRTNGGSEITQVSGTNASPAAWAIPGGQAGAFGYHPSDDTLCTGISGRFASTDTYAKLTASPEEVACSASPVVSGDITYVIFKVEVGSTQPNGSYQNTLTYITTAQF